MKMRTMLMLLAIGSVWYTTALPAETTSIDPVLARQYFDEIKKVSDADASHLWGGGCMGLLCLWIQAAGQLLPIR